MRNKYSLHTENEEKKVVFYIYIELFKVEIFLFICTFILPAISEIVLMLDLFLIAESIVIIWNNFNKKNTLYKRIKKNKEVDLFFYICATLFKVDICLIICNLLFYIYTAIFKAKKYLFVYTFILPFISEIILTLSLTLIAGGIVIIWDYMHDYYQKKNPYPIHTD